MPEILGVSLNRLEDPIRVALDTYQELSNNGLAFDSARACRLETTPTKTTSARSRTDVNLNGEKVGDLYVIAFKPGDGTGNEADYKLRALDTSYHSAEDDRVVPRRKIGIYEEAHLTLVSQSLDDAQEPKLYAGTFLLLGLREKRIIKTIGILSNHDENRQAIPTATYTVGYRGSDRFGDPHAVYSANQSIQVCGFFAVTDQIHKAHPDILAGLNPCYPDI